MTIVFDATPFARASAGAGARASLAWRVVVLDLGTGATVFSFQPEQLTATSRVCSGAGGVAVYEPGRLPFAATFGMLNADDTCQVTFAQASFASARQAGQVPQPATVAAMAAMGAGLLALAAVCRRRRNGPIGNY